VTDGSSYPRLIQHDQWRRYSHTTTSRLFETVGVVFSNLSTSSLPLVANQIFQGRTLFFAQPSISDQLGGHPQLILALMEIARRLGGQISARVEKADWIVVGRRTGKDYSYVSNLPSTISVSTRFARAHVLLTFSFFQGLGQPEKTLGSLHHFLSHLDPSVTEIIDVRSVSVFFSFGSSSAFRHSKLTSFPLHRTSSSSLIPSSPHLPLALSKG